MIAVSCAKTSTPTAPSCSFSVSPTALSFSAAGGSGIVTVTTSSGCSWSATSDSNWVSIIGGSTGSGSGQGTVSASPNAGTVQRTGTVTVAGRTVTITQSAAAQATLELSGNYTLEVVAAARCGWPVPTHRLEVVAGPFSDGQVGNFFYGELRPANDPTGSVPFDFVYEYTYSPGSFAALIVDTRWIVWNDGELVNLPLVGSAIQGPGPVINQNGRPEILNASIDSMSLIMGGSLFDCLGNGAGTLSLKAR